MRFDIYRGDVRFDIYIGDVISYLKLKMAQSPLYQIMDHLSIFSLINRLAINHDVMSSVGALLM